MSQYHWKGATFDIASELDDQSHLQFQRVVADEVTATLTVSAESAQGDLSAYVSASTADFLGSIDGWRSVQAKELGPDQTQVALEGPLDMFMVRTFRLAGDTVWCFTATGHQSERTLLEGWVAQGVKTLQPNA